MRCNKSSKTSEEAKDSNSFIIALYVQREIDMFRVTKCVGAEIFLDVWNGTYGIVNGNGGEGSHQNTSSVAEGHNGQCKLPYRRVNLKR